MFRTNFEASPNPHALGNIRQGRTSFNRGSRDRETVFRDHLRWNQGAAAEVHFRNGYWEAAEAAGLSRAEQLAATSFVDPIGAGLSRSEQVRRLEIICDEQTKIYGHAPMQWKLDEARRETR